MRKVLHSQRLQNRPLRPWFVAAHRGKMLCVHCICMAGLGESCAHVSTPLIFVDTAVWTRDTRTVTQEPAYWKIPTSGGNQSIAYLPLTKIDCTYVSKVKEAKPWLFNWQQHRHYANLPKNSTCDFGAIRGGNEHIFDTLAGTKAVVLSITPGYAQSFCLLSSQGVYPSNLFNLYATSNCGLSYSELLKKCQELHGAVIQE